MVPIGLAVKRMGLSLALRQAIAHTAYDGPWDGEVTVASLPPRLRRPEGHSEGHFFAIFPAVSAPFEVK